MQKKRCKNTLKKVEFLIEKEKLVSN